MSAQEVITRRHLPHWYVPGAAHFVTFRLAGTLPRAVLDELKQRKDALVRKKPPAGISAAQHRERIHKQLFATYDKYLDENREIVWLSDPRIAALMRSSLFHLHGQKYYLLAYTIMPNHVHALFQPTDVPVSVREKDEELGESEDRAGPLASIMHSLKGYTAHQANKILRRHGDFWQHESYDHWVRDEDELERIVQYIDGNTVAARLAKYPHEWYFCSAHDRYLTDGSSIGWLSLPASPVGQASSLALS